MPEIRKKKQIYPRSIRISMDDSDCLVLVLQLSGTWFLVMHIDFWLLTWIFQIREKIYR